MLTPPASPAALDRTIEDADNAIADARRLLGEHDFWPLRDSAEAMAQEEEFGVVDGRALQCRLQLVARACPAVVGVRRARRVGRYFRAGDPFFELLMCSPMVGTAAPERQSD